MLPVLSFLIERWTGGSFFELWVVVLFLIPLSTPRSSSLSVGRYYSNFQHDWQVQFPDSPFYYYFRYHVHLRFYPVECIQGQAGQPYEDWFRMHAVATVRWAPLGTKPLDAPVLVVFEPHSQQALEMVHLAEDETLLTEVLEQLVWNTFSLSA